MKKLLLLLFCILIFVPSASAEKFPVKITPIEIVSTHKNNINVGDWIKFKTVNDIYYNDKIYIKKGSIIVGIVDNLHENGAFADNAEIVFQNFITRNIDGDLVTIKYPLYMSRKNSVCKGYGDRYIKYIGVIFRGNEIKVMPNSVIYNLFLYK